MADDIFCAVSEGRRDEVVAIEVWAFDGDEDIAGAYEPRVVAQARAVRRANPATIRCRANKFQQFVKIHSVSFDFAQDK